METLKYLVVRQTFNPNSALYDLVIKATTNDSKEISSSFFLEVSNFIKTNPHLCDELADIIEKRLYLEVNHFNTQYKTLTLLEFLVKNCGVDLHGALANKNLASVLVKLGGKMARGKQPSLNRTIKQRNKDRVQRKVLEVIQNLSLNTSPELLIFKTICAELKARGVDFPKLSASDSVPYKKERSIPKRKSTDSLYISQHIKREIDAMKHTVIVFESLIEENEEPPSEDLMNEMYQESKEKKRILVKMIREQSGDDEIVMKTLLRLNERFDRALKLYDQNQNLCNPSKTVMSPVAPKREPSKEQLKTCTNPFLSSPGIDEKDAPNPSLSHPSSNNPFLNFPRMEPSNTNPFAQPA